MILVPDLTQEKQSTPLKETMPKSVFLLRALRVMTFKIPNVIKSILGYTSAIWGFTNPCIENSEEDCWHLRIRKCGIYPVCCFIYNSKYDIDRICIDSSIHCMVYKLIDL